MEYNDFLTLVKKRRSYRRFRPDPVPDDYIEKMLEAGRWAMSGGNGQPWEFVVVKAKVTKAKIGKIISDRQERHWQMELTRTQEYRHAWHHNREIVSKQVRPVNDAAAVIIICGDPRTFQATVIGNHFFSGEQDIFHMNLGNAAMIIHLAAASLGLGSAWMTIDRPAEHELKELLGIPKEYKIYVMVPVGYPPYELPPTYRRPLSEILHWEKYDKSKYRTHEQLREWLAYLRKLTIPAYESSVRNPRKAK